MAVSRQRHQHASLILLVATALYQVAFDHTVNQLDSTMMLDLESFRQSANRHFVMVSEALEREQQLVLLWLYAYGACGLLAKREKVAQLVAKLSQRLIIVRGQL